MIVRTLSTAVFACHDAACRPPKAGGSGGSLPARGGASAKRAAALVDLLEKPSGGLLNQAIFLTDDGNVEYLSEGPKGYMRITPEMVKGIHPVDLFHVIGIGGYSDKEIGLYGQPRPSLPTAITAEDMVRHLTGYDVVFDESAMNHEKPIGPNAPNGLPNWYKAVKAKG